MANGASISAVIAQRTPLRQAVGYAPAEEDSLAIVQRLAIVEERPLRAAAWVESKVGVVFSTAAFEVYIIAYLKAKTVSIEIARYDVLKAISVAVLEKDAANVVSVELFVGFPVAVQN